MLPRTLRIWVALHAGYTLQSLGVSYWVWDPGT